MSISDEQLMDLIKDVQTGNATKHDLAKAIQSEVYGLTYTVIQEEEESKKLTKNALAFICKNLDTFTAGLNVHRHIATLASVYLYSQVSDDETNTTVDYVYEYDRVREDEELLDTFKADAKAFKNPTYLKKTSRRFRKLDEVQMVILQLFAYEMNSVNVISQMLEVDEEVVRSLIAETRGDLLGIEPDLVDDVDDAEYDEAGEYDEDSARTSEDATGEEFAYDVSGTGESQDEFYGETENGDGEEAVPASGTMAGKVSANVDEDNCLTSALLKLFPTLTIKMRKVVTYCTAGVLALTIISVVVVALVMSRKTDSQALVDASSTDPTVETETETLADGSTITVTKASTVAPGQTVPLELAPTVATKATTAAATEATEETTSTDETTTGEAETAASETPEEDKDKESTAATTTTAAETTTTAEALNTTTTAEASNTTTAASGTPESSETTTNDSASSETATTTAAAAN